MPVYAAFLRAVNVGGTGKLPMADLRAMIEGIGGTDPQTWLASGNAVFAHDAPAAEVKARLAAVLETYAGKPVGVMIRDLTQLDAVLSALPFPGAEPKQLGLLLSDDPVPQDAAAKAKGLTTEKIIPGPGVLYIHYPQGMGRSKLDHPAMRTGTMRNLNTVQKLRTMLAEHPGAKKE
ncbi:Uncharacterized conserved protein, DUF1697 family [Mameliella alba]|uniref:DUF1697 domain-containing protein n=1 Tax=Mameliella alba TaxID=561184 RepID=UPI00088DE80D|nr:DUF1697 domain-containing protein [Mameliella alba]OWV49754.1 hypothetical protein CDZ96_05105 [Mameliella alba]PTR41748.1 uncharacterized protein (DUF1697 family) [Mameliella alba]GGF54139.1 hypothetical protein GCM10011319_14430 [Mameliella alba]SDC32014.1 Uncharacterized conserved protein, DUF1697 family [Mameliella alba]